MALVRLATSTVKPLARRAQGFGESAFVTVRAIVVPRFTVKMLKALNTLHSVRAVLISIELRSTLIDGVKRVLDVRIRRRSGRKVDGNVLASNFDERALYTAAGKCAFKRRRRERKLTLTRSDSH